MLADSPQHYAELAGYWQAKGRNKRIDVLLDIDVGMARTGSSPEVWHAFVQETKAAGSLPIVGVHAYEGHLGWNDTEACNATYRAAHDIAACLPAKQQKWVITSGTPTLCDALAYNGFKDARYQHQVSAGIAVVGDTRAVDGMRARDVNLRHALFVASRPVSSPAGYVCLDAGSKSIDPDMPADGVLVHDLRVVEVARVSEEHRVFRFEPTETVNANAPIFLSPSHACSTINLHGQVLYVRGDKFVGTGAIEARGHSLFVGDRRP